MVLNGDSAGAAAIVLLITSPTMKTANLFKGAIIESTSQVNLRTLKQAQEGYDCLVAATGCSNSTSTLSCLRSRNTTALQSPTCSFNPHIESPLIPTTPFHAFAAGSYLKIPTIFGTCADEGTASAPQNIATVSDFNAVFSNRVPSLSASSLTVLDNMYITNKTEPVFPNSGALWRNAANAYGDITFHCTTKIYQDVLVEDGVKTWSYRYAVRDPDNEASGRGAYHTVELPAVWGPNNTDGSPPKSYKPGGINAGIVDVVGGYWIGFVNGLDPNTRVRMGGQGRRERVLWETWGAGRWLRFVGNATAMEDLDPGERGRCRVLDPVVRVLEQVPPEGTVTELKGE